LTEGWGGGGDNVEMSCLGQLLEREQKVHQPINELIEVFQNVILQSFILPR
jgi:hypothetical protein